MQIKFLPQTQFILWLEVIAVAADIQLVKETKAAID